jgi:hypothetical protein
MAKVNECGVLPLSFLQALAAAVMVDSDGNTFLNMKIISPSGGRCDCTPAYSCNIQGANIENFVVSRVFELDECDNLTLKVGFCEI